MKKTWFLLIAVFFLGCVITFVSTVWSLRSKGTLTIHPAIHRVETKGDLGEFQRQIGLTAGADSIVVIRSNDPRVSLVRQVSTQGLNLHPDDRLICLFGYVPIDCYHSVFASHDTFCQLLLNQVEPKMQSEVQIYCVSIPQGVVIAPCVSTIHPSYPLK